MIVVEYATSGRKYFMKEEIKHRQDMVRFGKLLHERGYVAATDGNLSVRLDRLSILITPTCISKGTMRPQDLVVVEMQGRSSLVDGMCPARSPCTC
jgi:L-fuculose-phosphate aldolase